MLRSLHHQRGPIVQYRLLNRPLLIRALPALEHGDAPSDLNDGLGELLHFEFDDQLLQVAGRAITLLLDDQLTFRLAITLNFAFEAIAAIINFSLDLGQFFL